MPIYEPITLRGQRRALNQDALIDTGAEVSLIPSDVASQIGVWSTNYYRMVRGVHQDTRTLPIVLGHAYFPNLGVGGPVGFLLSEVATEIIIGMDILKPLGMSIDTTTGQVSVKNEVWEAFKTLAALGVLIVGGIKMLED